MFNVQSTNIFNDDECELFIKGMTNRSLVIKDDLCKSEKKMSKVHLYLMYNCIVRNEGLFFSGILVF